MSEGQKKQKTVPARSLARMGAVLALYQMDIAGTDLNNIISDFINSNGPSAYRSGADDDQMQIDLITMDQTLFKDILRGVVEYQKEIDQKIHDKLKQGWPLARIDATLRAILRAAGFEMLKRHDIPAKVIINEYVTATKAFFDDKEVNMVNGILDNIANELDLI